ncbi:hypothetical protein YDYSG_53170 [Paenibacillus tyrfis]|nr:hypothetical protein YDYSG_53170 [Paenibacillus tyrfis]
MRIEYGQAGNKRRASGTGSGSLFPGRYHSVRYPCTEASGLELSKNI